MVEKPGGSAARKSWVDRVLPAALVLALVVAGSQ